MSRHSFRDLAPILRLFLKRRPGAVIAGLMLAAATVLAGAGLLGLAGWFISATALAGLTAVGALAFDVFAPAAVIRFLALARTVSRYGERLVTHDATLSILADLRERLFRGWALPGAARALLTHPAKLLFRLTADIDALDSLYLRVLVPASAAAAVGLGVGLILALLSLPLGLAVMAASLGGGLAITLTTALASRAAARKRAFAVEALRARVVDLVAGQTDLVMAGRLPAQTEAVLAADARLSAADHALNRIDIKAGAGFSILSAVLLAGVLLVTSGLAAAGRIDAPLMAMALLITLGALEPFAGLRRGALELGRTLLAARRIAPRLAPAPDQIPLARPAAGLALGIEKVSFTHPGGQRSVVSDISLTLARGARLALVGPSGAGKSTLLALCAGEAEPAEGVIAAIPSTLLTQHTQAFSDTVADNLRLAAPDMDQARLWNALDAAGLKAEVEAMRQGLETRLGEGGQGLSGGQLRRLALARLVLRDTPLWLLDEPTEGLDSATASDVLARLKANATDRTLVIATHMKREAELANLILVMEKGRIMALHQRGEPGFAAALDALRPDRDCVCSTGRTRTAACGAADMRPG